jgi:hypothetical protein
VLHHHVRGDWFVFLEEAIAIYVLTVFARRPRP